MTPEEISQFWEEFHRHYQNGHGEQRKGQAMMNALRIFPELYDMVTGTKYDIFYVDTSEDIYRFREYIGV
jgi:hypothetical protein